MKTRLRFGRVVMRNLESIEKQRRETGEWGEANRLVDALSLRHATPNSFSRDGKFLAYSVKSVAEDGTWKVRVFDLITKKDRPVFPNSVMKRKDLQFSPTGNLIAYSDALRVCLRSYNVDTGQADGPERRVWHEGSGDPRWSKDGKQLFFQWDKHVMSVSVTFSNGVINVSTPVQVARMTDDHTGTYDVSYDGKRILVIGKDLESNSTPDDLPGPYTLNAIHNSFSWLNELAPSQ